MIWKMMTRLLNPTGLNEGVSDMISSLLKHKFAAIDIWMGLTFDHLDSFLEQN